MPFFASYAIETGKEKQSHENFSPFNTLHNSNSHKP